MPFSTLKSLHSCLAACLQEKAAMYDPVLAASGILLILLNSIVKNVEANLLAVSSYITWSERYMADPEFNRILSVNINAKTLMWRNERHSNYCTRYNNYRCKSPSFSVDYSSRVCKNRERISLRVKKHFMLTIFIRQI